MPTAALIDPKMGIVVNMIVADKSYVAPDGLLAIFSPPTWAGIGVEYTAGAFVKPIPPEVPKIEGVPTL